MHADQTLNQNGKGKGCCAGGEDLNRIWESDVSTRDTDQDMHAGQTLNQNGKRKACCTGGRKCSTKLENVWWWNVLTRETDPGMYVNQTLNHNGKGKACSRSAKCFLRMFGDAMFQEEKLFRVLCTRIGRWIKMAKAKLAQPSLRMFGKQNLTRRNHRAEFWQMFKHNGKGKSLSNVIHLHNTYLQHFSKELKYLKKD